LFTGFNFRLYLFSALKKQRNAVILAHNYQLGEVQDIHRLRKENLEKKFFSVSEQTICPHMKLTTLEKIVWSLKEMQYQIKVPARIANRAKKAVDRMLE